MKQKKIYGHAECDKIHLHTKTKDRKEKTKSPQQARQNIHKVITI